VFRVRIHGVANGIRTAASNEVRLFVNAPVAPSAPTNLLGGVSGSGVALSWRNTFEGGAPSSLVLDVSGAASATIPLSVSEGIAFTGVPPGTYTLRLRAANTAGTSPPSNPITLTFPGSCAAAPNGPPQLPGNFLAQRIGNTIRVTWNAPASGPAPSQYVLNVTGSFTGSFPLGAALAVSGNVGPGSYGLSVLAANPCGPGGATPVQTIVVP
jgi:titin